MFGILIAIAILVVFGFLYVWIANVVAREEVSVGIGIAILVLTGIVNFVFNLLVSPLLGKATSLVAIPVNFLVLAGMTVLLAKIPFKQALIIAAIFTVLMWVLAFGIAACAAAAA